MVAGYKNTNRCLFLGIGVTDSFIFFVFVFEFFNVKLTILRLETMFEDLVLVCCPLCKLP